ncbi:MAG: sigma-54-dependent Fis family transcriptional regulator [Myxococcales bacterium]|nr:MAG: sigma-54-dependent Fis family transcriptional regulator [Myxococcales bacterium]
MAAETQRDAKRPARILAVDDSRDALELIRRHLEGDGHAVLTASDVEEALRLLRETAVDLVVTDFKMPKQDGMDLIRLIRDNFRTVSVIMVTGYPSIEGAVEAVKLGADEYLAKPYTRKELVEVVDAVMERHWRRRMTDGAAPPPAAPEGLIGESETIRGVFEMIQKAAPVKATVLIAGESGTGKELVARAVHYRSDRASRPFVPVNCGGIPEGLLESELFGHVRGAFTGATETRAGFFQTADGGTIFLDEVSETGVAMQVKLLRVLQEKEVCMVGSARPQKADVRIIAGTNKHLPTLIKSGRFREDLYYRLNVIAIELPPLRERGDDVLLLARHFTAKYAREMGRTAPAYTDRALEHLKRYHWPGNVRELENLVQRLMAMTESDMIDAPDLPPGMRQGGFGGANGLTRTLAEMEAEYIRHVLESVANNKTKAAELLGIDRKTLREKLKRYGFDS